MKVDVMCRESECKFNKDFECTKSAILIDHKEDGYALTCLSRQLIKKGE